MSASTSAVRERPILFSGPMVRAILDGSKTQTRRVVKPRPVGLVDGAPCSRIVRARSGHVEESTPIRCPYGAPGDLLWVRETAWYDREAVDVLTGVRCFFDNGEMRFGDRSRGIAPGRLDAARLDGNTALRKRPGIHMPRWASRLTLRVLAVRIERLQEISEEDAKAEGAGYFGPAPDKPLTDRQVFEAGWDSINGKRAPWASNPWVWAVTFERVDTAAEVR